MPTRVDDLTDRQAIRVLAAVVGELADPTIPQRTSDQLAALTTLAAEFGETVPSSGSWDTETAAASARELLTLLSAQPQARPVIDDWLADPPTQEAAALPDQPTTALIVMACWVVVQIVSNTTITLRGKSWKVTYDPSRGPTLKPIVTEVIKILGRGQRQGSPGEPEASSPEGDSP
ncbi:hypothetical protein [Nocardia barduliensis]|uniref:hypothetical protein n=1 Tax=Nocardia barduliensis TaxID=2736643 RepID=UPI001574DCD1|nr:hypothetical protein [Nocardia barduliensis]